MKSAGRLNEGDLEETFSRASGPGGQNVNKVSTRVALRHRPSGLSVSVQDSRSRERNREIARDRLAQLVRAQRAELAAAQRQAREKERRRHSPRPRALRARLVEMKRRRAQLKKERRAAE